VLVSSSQKGPSPSEQFSRIHGCVMVSIWVYFVDAWRIEEMRMSCQVTAVWLHAAECSTDKML
jgi:hypothetical protein